ncbi:MAG: hypothetical protein ACI9I0_001655 [Rhodoferax sp.]|jgi:hypothetical protein
MASNQNTLANPSASAASKSGSASGAKARAAHRHADMGEFQRQGTIHAITSHSHNLAISLERLHDAQLLRRVNAGADAYGLHPRLPLGITSSMARLPSLGTVGGPHYLGLYRHKIRLIFNFFPHAKAPEAPHEPDGQWSMVSQKSAGGIARWAP